MANSRPRYLPVFHIHLNGRSNTDFFYAGIDAEDVRVYVNAQCCMNDRFPYVVGEQAGWTLKMHDCHPTIVRQGQDGRDLLHIDEFQVFDWVKPSTCCNDKKPKHVIPDFDLMFDIAEQKLVAKRFLELFEFHYGQHAKLQVRDETTAEECQQFSIPAQNGTKDRCIVGFSADGTIHLTHENEEWSKYDGDWDVESFPYGHLYG